MNNQISQGRQRMPNSRNGEHQKNKSHVQLGGNPYLELYKVSKGRKLSQVQQIKSMVKSSRRQRTAHQF